jgi:hypothetical protein
MILLATMPFLFAACHKHTRIVDESIPGADGQDGQDGQNGRDGIDGADGLSGIGFDYVRGMDGAKVCNRAIIVNANLVLPSSILMFAPAEDPYDPDGLTLTFGTQDLAFRVYLGFMNRGEYCVIEKEHGYGWQAIDQLVFSQDGFVAIVPEETLSLFEDSFVATLLEQGILVEFDSCKTLDYSRHCLKIGSKIRINFGRD